MLIFLIVDDAPKTRRIKLMLETQNYVIDTANLGEDGLVPLEVKFHHDPDSTHGFCGAALSSNVIHWWKDDVGKCSCYILFVINYLS